MKKKKDKEDLEYMKVAMKKCMRKRYKPFIVLEDFAIAFFLIICILAFLGVVVLLILKPLSLFIVGMIILIIVLTRRKK